MPQPATLDRILVRIDDVNRHLTPLEVAFSATLGEASRRTQEILEVRARIRRGIAGDRRHRPRRAGCSARVRRWRRSSTPSGTGRK